jgi:polysaccharide export outer membrane protein
MAEFWNGGQDLRRRAPASGRRALLRTVLWLVAAAVCMQTPGAWGQFSGPAPRPFAGLNVRLKPTTDPAILYPGPRDLRLDVGDQIQVHIFGVNDYSPILRVSLDGSVQIPLGGVIPVIGLTLHQAADAMAERLISAGMYRDPQISVQLTESPNQTITVTGELHGVLNTNGSERHLYEVIAGAGGLTNTSSHVITIERPGLEEPIVVDLGSDPAHSALGNVPVFPHDTVVVSRVGVVYMLGAFRTQGVIPLQQNTPLTLMQATSLASGDLFEGKFADLRIVRTVGLERKLVTVDISKVLKGKVPDPVLEPDDIVYLPTSEFKAALKNGGIGTALGLISLLVVSIQSIHP